MRLTFKNTVDKKVYNFDNLTDFGDSKLFYHVNIKLYPNMPDGSYEYALYDGDTLLAQGVVQVGDHEQVNTAYTKNNTYIQYKP